MVKPGKKQKEMASAYGGQANPILVTKVVPVQKKLKKRSPSSRATLDNLANSVSNFDLNKGGVDTSKLRAQF